MIRGRWRVTLAVAALLGGVAVAQVLGQSPRAKSAPISAKKKVLVELFTSQG